jgi:hypothetical protein
MFCDVNYIFVIILSPISSSHATYDENGHFVMEYVPFCDQSLQRHEQIVTDKHFSSSVRRQGLRVPCSLDEQGAGAPTAL